MTANAALPLTDLETVDRLGDDLRSAGYDAEGVPTLLGPSANRALARGEFPPALRATRERTPLGVLVRLFLLGRTESAADVAAALPRTGLERALQAQVLERVDGDTVRAGLDVRPHADDTAEYLVVSDLDSDTRPGPVRTDHVLGIGQASITLARQVIREPVERALDLGTGCGIQALHLGPHAGSIVATDVNRRALALAAATARLNGQRWDLRDGSLFDPIADETFDLIVSNPPFVIGTGEAAFTYRDSGMVGDSVCAALVAGTRQRLNPGGTAQYLANWIVRDDADWRTRVGDWVSGSGCEAWVVQRELADPAEYVGLWLADSGEAGSEQAAATAERWLDWFAAENVTGIGMGSIALRRTDTADPAVTLDELTAAGDELTGPEVAAFLARRSWVLQRSDRDLLATPLSLAADAILEHRAVAGHEGWTTVLRMLARDSGPGATLQLDEWGEALLGGCTGLAPLSLQIELLAAVHGLNEDALAAAVLPSVRVAITRGLLHPVAA